MSETNPVDPRFVNWFQRWVKNAPVTEVFRSGMGHVYLCEGKYYHEGFAFTGAHTPDIWVSESDSLTYDPDGKLMTKWNNHQMQREYDQIWDSIARKPS